MVSSLEKNKFERIIINQSYPIAEESYHLNISIQPAVSLTVRLDSLGRPLFDYIHQTETNIDSRLSAFFLWLGK
ncbi:hypothetical protein ACTXT7_008922 [Hymenolepis weldensis]